MKRRITRREKWRMYEAEKLKLQKKGLDSAAYDEAIKEIVRRLRL